MPTGRKGAFQRVKDATKETAEVEHSRTRRADEETALEKPRLRTYHILPRHREGVCVFAELGGQEPAPSRAAVNSMERGDLPYAYSKSANIDQDTEIQVFIDIYR